jgi:hypothetical protein
MRRLELAAQNIPDQIGIGFALRCLHGLADEKSHGLGHPIAVAVDGGGIRGQDLIDNCFQLTCIGDLPVTVALNKGFRHLIALKQARQDVPGRVCIDRATFQQGQQTGKAHCRNRCIREALIAFPLKKSGVVV